MRHLRRCAPFVFVALAAVTCSPRTDDPFVSPAAEPPRVVYAYDEMGRLRAVTDVESQTAVYRYDAVGNITGISRRPSRDLSVVSVVPGHGPPGASVVVRGTGFAPSPGGNRVSVGGVPAEVTSASRFSLRFVVPEGARPGPVTVTVERSGRTGQTASSAEPFRPSAARGPSIARFSPAVVAPGGTVTIEGSGFSGDPLRDAVTVGDTYAAVSSASERRLVVTVPPVATAGRVAVATPDGRAESAGELFVVPDGYAPTDVGFVGRASAGEPATVTTDGPGEIGLLAFAAHRGDRLEIDTDDSPGSSDDPSTRESGGPAGGDPADAETGASGGSGGGPGSVETGESGGPGRSGESRSDSADAETGGSGGLLGGGAGCGARLGLVAPGGIELASAAANPADITSVCGGDLSDVGALPVDGTYLLVVAPPGATGSTTLTVGVGRPPAGETSEPAGALSPGGAPAAGGGPVAPPDSPQAGVAPYPVDLATGGLVFGETDLVVDDVLPVSLDRTYQPGDSVVRAFGSGSGLGFDLHLRKGVGFQSAEVVLPNGVGVRYDRTSDGTDAEGAVFEHTATPSALGGSRITWNGNGWDLTLADGTVLAFASTGTIEDPLQAVRDRNGNQITISRERNRVGSPVGRVTAVHSHGGRSITLAYDGRDRVVAARDHLGRRVRYGYDGAGRLRTVTEPAGGTTTYGYDGAGRIRTITGPGAAPVVVNEYDAAGRVVRQTGPDGGRFSFRYATGDGGRVVRTVVTDPAGVARRVDFSDGYWVRDVAAAGTPVQQAVTVERARGSHLVTTVTDPGGRRTAIDYDELGRRASVTALAGTRRAVTTTYEYEGSSGRVASVTDPLGRTVSYRYDEAGNLAAEIDPAGATTRYGYDGRGRLVSVTDAAGNATEAAYDLLHRVTVTDPVGRSTRSFLDAGGRRAVVTDGAGRRTELRYDAVDRLVGVSDPGRGETAFGYDARGNTTSLTDAAGNVTRWSHDPMGRVVTRTDPLGAVDRYAYDAVGNLARHQDRRGTVTEHVTDALGRPARVSFGGESTVRYRYDPAGRVARVDDSAYGAIELEYDGLDQVVAESSPQGRVTYGYDAAGQRTSMAVEGGPETTYRYDSRGLVSSISRDDLAVSARRDRLGRVRSLSLPNGVVARYGYDAAGDVTAISYSTGDGVRAVGYRYDRSGRRVSVSGDLAPTGMPRPVESARHDAGNRVVQWGGAALSYDAAGNLTGDGTHTYRWDARGQLAGVSSPSGNVAFAYDPFGRRVASTVDGSTTSYLYDGANVARSRSGSDGTPVDYLTGLGVDELYARAGPSGTTTYLVDGLGSTVGLVGEDGDLATRYTHSPYGSTRVEGDEDPNPFAFTGREPDPTGAYYHRARYYRPDLGRFLSEDPLGFGAGDANLYAYASGDPANVVDPSGLCGLDVSLDVLVSGLGLFAEVQRTFNPGGALDPRANDVTSQEYLAAADDYLHGVRRQADLTVATAAIACGVQTLTPLAAAAGAPSAAASGAGSAGTAAATSTAGAGAVTGGPEATLYRAISRAEVDDIVSFGGFRAGPNSYEGKLFATSAEDAARYGRGNYALTAGGEPFHIVEVRLPAGLERSFYRGNMDTMQAVHVSEEELATLNATARWSIWDRVPLVGKPPWIR